MGWRSRAMPRPKTVCSAGGISRAEAGGCHPAARAGAPAQGAGRPDTPGLYFLRAFGAKHPYMRGYEFS